MSSPRLLAHTRSCLREQSLTGFSCTSPGCPHRRNSSHNLRVGIGCQTVSRASCRLSRFTCTRTYSVWRAGQLVHVRVSRGRRCNPSQQGVHVAQVHPRCELRPSVCLSDARVSACADNRVRTPNQFTRPPIREVVPPSTPLTRQPPNTFLPAPNVLAGGSEPTAVASPATSIFF